jgi:DNA polymerase-3 subunit epsilon
MDLWWRFQGRMDGVADKLFELEDSGQGAESGPEMMTPRQRQTIRELFAQIGVVEAREQFDLVSELTGVRIASVAELQFGPANVLIQTLRGRASRAGRASTGNAWADRDEDTWIDRL